MRRGEAAVGLAGSGSGWRSSLQTRLVAYFLMLSASVALLATSLVYVGVRETLRREKLRDVGLAATLQREQIYPWLQSGREDVRIVATVPVVTEVCERLFGATSEEDREAAREELRELVSWYMARKPALRELLFLSAEGGEVVVSSQPRNEGEYRARDTAFVEGLRGLTVHGVYPSPMTLRPTLTISAPILSSSGETLGVAAAHLDLELLDRIVGMRADLGVSGESYLVDEYGGFVSAARFGRVGNERRGIETLGIERALARQDGAAHYENYDGVPVIGAYRWIEELELALLIEVDEREALAPARALAGWVLAGSAGLAALLSLGASLIARGIARPIRRISAAAVEVGQGDLDTAVPVPTEDEIGVLAESFNRMTGRLRELYGELASEIAERKLAQEERETFVEELEAKNAELERFTYTVSHDLKSPLVTINGFLMVLRKDLEDGKTDRLDDAFGRIEDATVTMRQSLDELLELSRIGRVVNPPEPCDLGDLCREAVEMVSGEIDERGVEVAVQAEMPVVLVDRVRIREVFLNLVSNAVKFLGEQPRPRVEIGAFEDDGVICWVRDNGIGVPPAYHDKIFGLFERLEPGTDGTGIGLALVKRIVEVHGGRAWVESAGEGAGSTFWFSLPKAPPGRVSAAGG